MQKRMDLQKYIIVRQVLPNITASKYLHDLFKKIQLVYTNDISGLDGYKLKVHIYEHVFMPFAHKPNTFGTYIL